jgi:hypothetical protein
MTKKEAEKIIAYAEKHPKRVITQYRQMQERIASAVLNGGQ